MSQQINLYHPIFRKQLKRFSAMAMLQASGIMLFGIVTIYMFLLWHVNQLRTAVAEVSAQSAAAAKRFEDVNARFSANSVTQQIARVEQEIAARQPIMHALQQGALGNRTGYSAYFVAFSRQHVPGLWLTGFSIDGSDKLSLEGRTRNRDLVPLYISRLGKEQSLKGMQLQAFLLQQPKTSGKTVPGYLEFQVSTGEPASKAR